MFGCGFVKIMEHVAKPKNSAVSERTTCCLFRHIFKAAQHSPDSPAKVLQINSHLRHAAKRQKAVARRAGASRDTSDARAEIVFFA